MDKPLNTKYVYTFEDDTTTEMTLAFYLLYQLRSKNRSLYDRHNKIMARMGNRKEDEYDEIDSVLILYTAYVCAHLNDESIMTEEEFLIKCGSDRKAVGAAVKALLNPKN